MRAGSRGARRFTPSSRTGPGDGGMVGYGRHGHSPRVREHRARQVLGQAGRATEHAGDRQPVADAGGTRRPRRPSTFDPKLEHDELELDGRQPPARSSSAWRSSSISSARSAGVAIRARVTSRNEFPTASGLASSASGSPRSRVAATHAAGLELTPRELSILARRGSGSAARSIFGGFVRMRPASITRSAYAEPIESPLARSRAHGGRRSSAVARRSSTARAMRWSTPRRRRRSSAPGSTSCRADLVTGEAALAAGDLEQLGTLAEATRSRCTRARSPRDRRSSTGGPRRSPCSPRCAACANAASPRGQRWMPART